MSDNEKNNIKKEMDDHNSFYKIDEKNWYKSLPYAFDAIIDNEIRRFYLPINPQNISITTHYATNIIATISSTVEEHSKQRYFDIAIQGTTGFAPRYTKTQNPTAKITELSGRSSYANSGGILSDMSIGAFQKILGEINQIANRATDIVSTIKGESNKHESGIFAQDSGYVAFHNLYRFFLSYKKSAASGKSVIEKNDSTPLTFLNYKDSNKYSCVVNRFTLERSVENPMLYNYSIQLRAYNIRPIESTDINVTNGLLGSVGLGNDAADAAKKLKKIVGSIRAGTAGTSNIIGNK